MKLGHIVKYHNVFVKFDNGPYLTMPSGAMKLHHIKRCPLSKSNTFDHNFMKLGHIGKYHDVFVKFDNGPDHTLPSGVMALCLRKFTI